MTKEKIDCREGMITKEDITKGQFVIQITSAENSETIEIQSSPKDFGGGLEMVVLAAAFETQLLDLRKDLEEESYKEMVNLLLDEIKKGCLEEEGADADD